MIPNLNEMLKKLIAGEREAAQHFLNLFKDPQVFSEEDITYMIHRLKWEADKKNSYALWLFALMIDHSVGFEKNNTYSITLLDEAVQLNNPFAMNMRAHFYEISHEYEKAKELYEKSLDLSYGDAANHLGLLYQKGYVGAKNGEPDYDKAADYFETGAVLNHPEATRNFAFLIEKELIDSVYDDYCLEAYEYYIQALTLGYRDAANDIGRLFEKGHYGLKNGKPDVEKAKEYYAIGATLKTSPLPTNRKKVENQITEVQQMAFFSAIKENNLAFVKELLDAGLNPNFVYHYATPLFYAAELGRVEIVKLLIQAKAELDWQHGWQLENSKKTSLYGFRYSS